MSFWINNHGRLLPLECDDPEVMLLATPVRVKGETVMSYPANTNTAGPGMRGMLGSRVTVLSARDRDVGSDVNFD